MYDELIENSIDAAELFYNGELTEDELYSLIYQGYVDEEALSEAFDYLEEGKLWSQWRAHVNDIKSTEQLAKNNFWKAEKYGKRAIERTNEVLDILNKRKEKLDKKKGAHIRKWWNRRQLDKHNSLKSVRQRALDSMFTRVR